MTGAEVGRGRAFAPLLLTVALGGVLAPLNSTMIAVALPEIRGDFAVGHGAIGWLVSAYLIAMAVAQPLGGRIGDQLGRARVFRAGLLLFLAFSLAAAFSPNFLVMIALRTGQALVGAVVIPNGMAMLREALPVTSLGRASGLIGSAMSLAAATGPLLGAGLLAAWSWRLLFLVNAPLVLLALLGLALLRYPTGPTRRLQVDWPGALAFGAALVALTLLLNALGGATDAWLIVVATVVFVAAALLFVQRQRGSELPVAEWRLFRNRSYAAATSYILLNNLVMYTTLLTVPFFVEEVQGRGNGSSGLLLGTMSVVMALTSPVGGRISDAVGRRGPALVGSLVVLGGATAVLLGLDRDVSFGYLALALGVLGLGIGLSFGAAQTAAIEAAPRALAGSAAGTNAMMRYLGSIVGAGVLGAVLGSSVAAPDVAVFRLLFGVLVAMAALAAGATLLIHRFPAEAHGPERPAPTPGLTRAPTAQDRRVEPVPTQELR